jgi:hypothetical protein
MSEVAVARVEPLLELERSGALTSTGLVLPNTITRDQYEALGAALGEVYKVVQWAVGDFITDGEQIFGEDSAQLIETLGMGEESRLQYARVARTYDRASRRKELSWSHHLAVASVKDEARRAELLEQAVVNKWSTHELNAYKKDEPVGVLPEPSTDFKYRQLRTVAVRVFKAREMHAGGDFYMVPTSVMEELGDALEVGGIAG